MNGNCAWRILNVSRCAQRGKQLQYEKTKKGKNDSERRKPINVADGTHCNWNWLFFKKKNINDRFVAVRKQHVCCGCLGKWYAINHCKVNTCSINGCTMKRNRSIHSESQMEGEYHAVNVSAATSLQSNKFAGFLQMVPVSIQSGSNGL